VQGLQLIDKTGFINNTCQTERYNCDIKTRNNKAKVIQPRPILLRYGSKE
jgi:hypothetical protein